MFVQIWGPFLKCTGRFWRENALACCKNRTLEVKVQANHSFLKGSECWPSLAFFFFCQIWGRSANLWKEFLLSAWKRGEIPWCAGGTDLKSNIPSTGNLPCWFLHWHFGEASRECCKWWSYAADCKCKQVFGHVTRRSSPTTYNAWMWFNRSKTVGKWLVVCCGLSVFLYCFLYL